MSMYIYHYYDRTIGPFKNLSDVSPEEAQQILLEMRDSRPYSQPAQRDIQYMNRRRNYEKKAYEMFVEKGGKPTRTSPHYMVVEYCKWLKEWYQNSEFIKIPVEEFEIMTISFTYGDSMPTFSPTINDGKEYRKKLYTYDEIIGIIEKYGLPQDWNDDGKYGPERYIEAHVWSDETINKYRL